MTYRHRHLAIFACWSRRPSSCCSATALGAKAGMVRRKFPTHPTHRLLPWLAAFPDPGRPSGRPAAAPTEWGGDGVARVYYEHPRDIAN
jgi:hypothetical protein